jgi:predicted TIM-barrel fold metal-dependent hydrolase
MGIANNLASNIIVDLGDTLLISGDSHVNEPEDLWEQRLPAALRDKAPAFPRRRQAAGYSEANRNISRPGGTDPTLRVGEMAQDGVSAEVLFPTLGLRLYAMEDAKLQEACFRAYNDWLIEYCSVARDRLFGVAMISVYDIDNAIEEMRRCKNAGMVGAMIWQVPPENLPFTSEHYERFWAAAQDLDMPIQLHILTGFDYSVNLTGNRGGPLEAHRGSVNLKTAGAMNTLMDIIFTGVLERFPNLVFNVVESEIGWIPFILQQWDYYVLRNKSMEADSPRPLTIRMLPSEYFDRQMSATFFNDPVGGRVLEWWGQNNCMWSSDYPHPNSPWPHSREFISKNLGHLPMDTITKLVRDNVSRFYKIPIPQPVNV